MGLHCPALLGVLCRPSDLQDQLILWPQWVLYPLGDQGVLVSLCHPWVLQVRVVRQILVVQFHPVDPVVPGVLAGLLALSLQ